MRIALAILLALHGLAHLVGFAVPWRIAKSAPYSTTLLSGHVDLGHAGIRAYGILWLLLAIAFMLAAAGAATDRAEWIPLAIGASIASLALSVLSWPDSRIGVPVNLAILGVVFAGSRLDWL